MYTPGLIACCLILIASGPNAASETKAKDSMKSDLTLAEAELIVQTFLQKDRNPHDLKIVAGKTTEHSFGFVVSVLPKKQIETGDWQKHGVPGVGPLIVDRRDRNVHQLGSSGPPHAAIKAYEVAWKSGITEAKAIDLARARAIADLSGVFKDPFLESVARARDTGHWVVKFLSFNPNPGKGVTRIGAQYMYLTVNKDTGAILQVDVGGGS